MTSIKKEAFSCVRDNMTIRGLYFHPEGASLPIAIISHGFMANYQTTKGYAQWFAERGYAAFCFDFNGGGLMGCSQGGVVSALAAAKLQHEIHQLILFYPALCIPDDARA